MKRLGDSAASLSKEFQNFVSDIEDLVKTSTSLTGDELAALEPLAGQVAGGRY